MKEVVEVIVKALSVKEPYASWIAFGQKTIETRTWSTVYRGPLLICASKTPKTEYAGYGLVIVDLVDCRPMTVDDKEAAQCPWYRGAYSWVLQNKRVIQRTAIRRKHSPRRRE